jgi:2-C-methyl-D-erythritol 2,4-cyclodiphosphate synthase (EC 4.6.1.12)
MFRIGYGIDFHQLALGRELWLGGVLVPHTHGALGHSDADVLLHAICDALLGAVAAGDIGVHFPDTDMRYKNISSSVLLRESYQIVQQKGFRIINIDSTVCLEQPKIRPYIPRMKEAISASIPLPVDAISVKATTCEKMGFVGRGERSCSTCHRSLATNC